MSRDASTATEINGDRSPSSMAPCDSRDVRPATPRTVRPTPECSIVQRCSRSVSNAMPTCPCRIRRIPREPSASSRPHFTICGRLDIRTAPCATRKFTEVTWTGIYSSENPGDGRAVSTARGPDSAAFSGALRGAGYQRLGRLRLSLAHRCEWEPRDLSQCRQSGRRSKIVRRGLHPHRSEEALVRQLAYTRLGLGRRSLWDLSSGCAKIETVSIQRRLSRSYVFQQFAFLCRSAVNPRNHSR